VAVCRRPQYLGGESADAHLFRHIGNCGKCVLCLQRRRFLFLRVEHSMIGKAC
jgi:hypothetical protein